MIYQITNFIQNECNYVCPDQATITAGQVAGYTGIFSIGTETDANNILATNQNAWLTKQASLFHTNKEVPDPSQPGYIIWEVVDLNTEPANTDQIYQVFDVVNGYYNQATGLTAAQTLFAQTQQNYLVFCNLGSVTNLGDTWPALPQEKKPVTTGTQTL